MKLAQPLMALAALATLAAASAAHARTDVMISIGTQRPLYAQPHEYVQPQPVYVQPQTMYVQPQPHGYFHPQPAYVAPRVVYHEPARAHHRGRGGPWGDSDRDGVPNLYDRDSRFFDWRAARQARRDIDGDGVRNRFDRAPYDPYYR